MAYTWADLQRLVGWIGTPVLPRDGAILELGSQDMMEDCDGNPIAAAMRTIRGEVSELNSRKVGALFAGSDILYRALDLVDEDFVLNADLNTWRVPGEYAGRFDLVTNHGTTEHVADQMNVFRIVHDAMKVGGHAFHVVPSAGYFNHGLYNYHPAFFAILAAANDYKVLELAITQPHLPHMVPQLPWLHGSESWRGVRQESGLLVCFFQKTTDAPFRLFSDAPSFTDAPVLREMFEGRYNLRLTD